MSPAGPLEIRSLDPGKRQAARDRELAEGSPLLSVFGTDSDEPVAWLATGQAVQRVLLRARAAGVWLNSRSRWPDCDPNWPRAIGHRDAHPQLLVRFGYGRSVKPEPRRAVQEVLVER